MKWLIDAFYLQPVACCFLVLVIYFPWVFFYYEPRKSRELERATSEIGLKQISLNQFSNYLNKTSCPCIRSRFDGSGINTPVIENIYTGKQIDLTITLFLLVLPTLRHGISQTVVHLRSDSTDWLPVFSVIDEHYGKKMSEFLRCKHSVFNPLTNPRCINRHAEANKLRASLARNPIPDTSIAGLKSPLNGVVVDSTGEDLFYYRHGVTEMPFQFKELIDRAIKLRAMIDSGKINIEVFRDSPKQKAIQLYLVSRWMLVSYPGLLVIMLLGYGYIGFSIAYTVICLFIFVYARFRIYRYNVEFDNEVGTP